MTFFVNDNGRVRKATEEEIKDYEWISIHPLAEPSNAAQITAIQTQIDALSATMVDKV